MYDRNPYHIVKQLPSTQKKRKKFKATRRTIRKYVVSFDPKFCNWRTGPPNTLDGAHRAFHLSAQATVKHTAKTTIRKQAVNLGLMITSKTMFS